jgi:hypothetical protein
MRFVGICMGKSEKLISSYRLSIYILQHYSHLYTLSNYSFTEYARHKHRKLFWKTATKARVSAACRENLTVQVRTALPTEAQVPVNCFMTDSYNIHCQVACIFVNTRMVSEQPECQIIRVYKVVQIWPGQTVTCLHTNSPGHIWTTLYICYTSRI